MVANVDGEPRRGGEEAREALIRQVVAPRDGSEVDLEAGAFVDKDGVSCNSGPIDGMDFKSAFDRVAEDLEAQRERDRVHWEKRLERAHFQAERARRQYDAVEPENRLVARTLERQGDRWRKQLGGDERNDVFLAWIGYPETRHYVEKVLIDREIYDAIIGGEDAQ